MRPPFYTFFCFLVLTALSFGQDKAAGVLFDEFGDQCIEHILARRDYFFQALGESPGSRGVIIMYGIREMEGRNAKLQEYFSTLDRAARSKHLNTGIRVIRGENHPLLKLQFWVVPRGATEPQPEQPYKPETYETTKRFDLAWADFERRDEGQLGIYSESFNDLGCDFSPNRALLSKILKRNPALKLHLIGYRGIETKASRARRVLNFAVRDLVRNYKIPTGRISSAFGGLRKESQIEFFLVPKNGRLPGPSPDPDRDVY